MFLADLFVLWFMSREFPDRLNDQSTHVCKWLLYEQAILDIGGEVDIEGKCDLSKSTMDRSYTSCIHLQAKLQMNTLPAEDFDISHYQMLAEYETSIYTNIHWSYN